MSRHFIKDLLGWGVILWFIGYVLGIVLFMVVPTQLVGWVIMPIGTIVTVLVLLKKIKGNKMSYFFCLSVSWTLIAIVFDYLFLVRLLKPADGYYKPDVYIYYFLTFLLPVLVGWRKTKT